MAAAAISCAREGLEVVISTTTPPEAMFWVHKQEGGVQGCHREYISHKYTTVAMAYIDNTVMAQHDLVDIAWETHDRKDNICKGKGKERGGGDTVQWISSTRRVAVPSPDASATLAGESAMEAPAAPRSSHLDKVRLAHSCLLVRV